jgi:hypothetical protein
VFSDLYKKGSGLLSSTGLLSGGPEAVGGSLRLFSTILQKDFSLQKAGKVIKYSQKLAKQIKMIMYIEVYIIL